MARSIRSVLLALAAATLVVTTASPAAAVPPTHATQTFSGSVTDNGEACGDPLSWEFTGEAMVTRFFDESGALDRIQVLVQESGTVTNLATGEVVELPTSAFVERVLRLDDGSLVIEDVGLSVRVNEGGDFLLDVGRFVVQLNPDELLQSDGQHPIREINPFSVSDPALLGAFCELFA
jgi:hypothetical protein